MKGKGADHKEIIEIGIAIMIQKRHQGTGDQGQGKLNLNDYFIKFDEVWFFNLICNLL